MSLTERIYWIDAQIRDNRFPHVDTVCDHFGISRRTAFSDRKYLLERLNAPLVYDADHGGWTYTDFTYVLPFLALSEQEKASLRRTLLAAQEYLSESDAHAVRLVIERLAPYLTDPYNFETISGSIHFAREGAIPSDLLEACRRSTRHRHRLFLGYYSAHRNEETERIVRPYHLHNFQGEWHLIAWCEWRQDYRQFFLGRVRTWEVLEPDASFLRDAHFDVDSYLRQGLGVLHGSPPQTVCIRFSPRQARWIRERQYHTTQRIEEEPNGGLQLTMQVAGLEEVLRWVLSYGAEAEVLDPLELRHAVESEIEKMREKYVTPG